VSIFRTFYSNASLIQSNRFLVPSFILGGQNLKKNTKLLFTNPLLHKIMRWVQKREDNNKQTSIYYNNVAKLLFTMLFYTNLIKGINWKNHNPYFPHKPQHWSMHICLKELIIQNQNPCFPTQTKTQLWKTYCYYKLHIMSLNTHCHSQLMSFVSYNSINFHNKVSSKGVYH